MTKAKILTFAVQVAKQQFKKQLVIAKDEVDSFVKLVNEQKDDTARITFIEDCVKSLATKKPKIKGQLV